MKPVMFFDGDCPLCRREVAHYRRLDRGGAVQWVDIAADPSPLQPLGVSRADAMRRLHALDAEGRLRVGAWAFAAIWEALPYYRWLGRLVRLPGLLPALDWAYRRFADWRFARRCRDGSCSVP